MMAGGRGQRLKPENTTMKPLLGGRCAIKEHKSDWLLFGIDDFGFL
jgi:GTP:adenosylcobinamide-phosphate guanylyltransferase